MKSLSRVRLFATPWTAARRLLCPWDSPGKNTGVGFHFLPYCTWTTIITAFRWTSVTAQFYLESKGKYILEAWGHADPKDVREERERPLALWLLFVCFFLLLLDLPYVNWASPKCCFFYLRSSLQSSDLPLFYFCGLFSSLSFSHHHSRLLSPILPT